MNASLQMIAAASPARVKFTISVVVLSGSHGNAARACFEYAEISHSPLGRIMLTSMTRSPGLMPWPARNPATRVASSRRSAYVYCSLRPLARSASRLCRMALGRSLKQLEQIAIRVDALRLRAHFVFECWKYPLGEAGQVNVQPVVVPVKVFRVPGEQVSLFFT